MLGVPDHAPSGARSPRTAEASGPRRRGPLRLASAFAASAVLGCATPPAHRAARPDEATQAAASRAIVSSSEALRRLETFDSSGVCRIEVPREDAGFDEEQLDLLLILERPRKSALRLKLSVSDTLAWLGSDGDRWWLFLPEESPSVAYRGSLLGETIDAGGQVEEAPVPRPLRDPRLFWLLAGLDPPRDPAAPLAWDGSRSAWVLEEAFEPVEDGLRDAAGMRVRRGFEARGDVVFVEVDDAEGRRIASSSLSDHVFVEVEGVALGARPRVATRITLEGAMSGDGRAMLVLERPSGRGSRVKPALFEWDRLVASMRPERIVEVAP